MKATIRLILVATVLIAGTLLIHNRPVSGQTLTCIDCVELCLLENCGFDQDPACVAANTDPCTQGCPECQQSANHDRARTR